QLMSNGLALADRAVEIGGLFDEVYLSLDGWDPASYKRFRGVDGFSALGRGIAALRAASADVGAAPPRFVARSPLQHENAAHLEAIVAGARVLGFDAISFLAVDPGAHRFGRSRERRSLVPDLDELSQLSSAIDRLADDPVRPLGRFVLEPEPKLRSIHDHLY